MDNLEFILAKRTHDDSPTAFLLWRRDADPLTFWVSDKVPKTERLGGFERLATVALHSDDTIVLGMNTGEVYRFSAGGTINTHSRFPAIGHGELHNELHELATGARSITGLVMHNGTLYDGSAAGVYATEHDWCVSPHVALALDSYAGRLVTVPTRACLGPKGSFMQADTVDRFTFPQGSLVDVFTGDVLANQVTPFDGSGRKPGTFAIAGSTLYMHHGNYPAERITARQLPENQELGHTMIYSSAGLIPHNGAMFDIRLLPLRGPQGGYVSALVSSNEDFGPDASTLAPSDDSAVFFMPEEITSGVSAGDDILFTVYHREEDRTRILAYDGAKARTVGNSDGYVKFLRHRRQ